MIININSKTKYRASGVEELSIVFRNNILPISHPFYPLTKPQVAEVYGVSVLTAVAYVIIQLNKWHGKPINSGFHDAFIAKGGYKFGYLLSKYLKGVLAHTVVIAVVMIAIYGRGFRMPGNFLIFVLFILINPLMVLAFSSFFTINRNLSYKLSESLLNNITGYLMVFALVSAGSLAYS